MQRENDVFILYKKKYCKIDFKLLRHVMCWYPNALKSFTVACFHTFIESCVLCIVRYTSELIYCWWVDNGFDGFPSLKSKSTFLCFVRAREVETYVMWILTYIYLLFSVRNQNFQVSFLLLQKVKTFLVHIIGKVSLWYMRFCFQLE